jgi:hypothetical protein
VTRATHERHDARLTHWDAILADTSHRPYPLPRGRLKGTMSWFAVSRQGEPYRADIHHQPWLLQSGHGVITTLDMALPRGLTLGGQQPLLHFARRNDVLAWPLPLAAHD